MLENDIDPEDGTLTIASATVDASYGTVSIVGQNRLGNRGFIHRRAGGMEMFLDGPAARARDAVHLVFANEMA